MFLVFLEFSPMAAAGTPPRQNTPRCRRLAPWRPPAGGCTLAGIMVEKVGKTGGRPQGGARPGAGRKPGVPNRATTEFRDTIRKLLEDNADNFGVWLRAVAEGEPAVYDSQGKLAKAGRPPNPGEAIRCASTLAEFAAPRLSRSEVTGEGSGPLSIVIHKLG